MSSPLVHYWHEDNPPEEIISALSSFNQVNPKMTQHIFSNATAEEFIRANFGAREVAAFRACAIPAMQADYFRYCAVYVLAGLYADANYRCISGLETLLNVSTGGVLFGRQDPVPRVVAEMCNWQRPVGDFRTLANNMFGFRQRQHPLLELAIEIATANIESRVADGPVGVWLSAGPGVFTSMYLLRELGSFDAFIEYSVGSVIEPTAPLFCELVGEFARITQIFDGVSIFPATRKDSLVVKIKRPPGTNHWSRPAHSIYR